MKRNGIYIGTSGYVYFWNEGKPTPFEWYLKQGFNSVEINASFYRFPSPSWVKRWLKASPGFTFSIKVHRSITHYTKLRRKALELWSRFSAPLRPLEHRIVFWLFQMPPRYPYKQENVEAVRSFIEATGLGNRAVIEFRHSSWWRAIDDVRETGSAFCSIDAPDLPRDIVSVNDVVYLRLHGRDVWYNYVYLEEELEEVLSKVMGLRADKKAIYLNNDHGMLENGRYLLSKAGLAG